MAADEPRPKSFQSWSIGDTPDIANELGALVLQRIKTGTASLAWKYAHDKEPLPRAGAHSIVLEGAGEPLFAIETNKVCLAPFDQVNEKHACAEGEGIRSLAHRRDAHRRRSSRWCAEIGCQPS